MLEIKQNTKGSVRMAYSELIKNFDNIRSYMREFFIYGFKTREEYDKKSARSYDNERRRIQSYLGDLVSFRQTSLGKKLFISLDGRSVTHNPLYRAFKAKSFTNKDITLHFILLDILASGEIYTNQELLHIIDTEYLSEFNDPMSLDESTLRKKLKEYEKIGLVKSVKEGRLVKYGIARDEICLEDYRDGIRFFTEENILGVVGSYLEDMMEEEPEPYAFKNHYIMNAYDTEIIYQLLKAIYEKRKVEIVNFSRRTETEKNWSLIPIKLYVSTQGGRSYLMCKSLVHGQILSYRIDYIQKVTLGDVVENYDEAVADFDKLANYMWGVVCNSSKQTEHIEIDFQVNAGENYIVRRLRRERRCGTITKIDENIYRFTADVFDTYEMVPWIRSFYGRIKGIRCNNEAVINELKADIVKMAKQYEVTSY